MKCRAYAKALHYKEEEFHRQPTTDTLEALISINNKLQQPESAAGVLEYAMKHHRSDLVRGCCWLWFINNQYKSSTTWKVIYQLSLCESFFLIIKSTYYNEYRFYTSSFVCVSLHLKAINVSTERLKWRLMLRKMRKIMSNLACACSQQFTKIKSSDWPKWHCALWRYITVHLFLDKTSF